MPRGFALIQNPAAARGRAQKLLPLVGAELERLGADYRLVETDGLEDARQRAAAAGAAGETVMVLGGDGSVGPLAGALRETPGALAIVPAGRGNDFARVLGVPLEPRAAVRLAVEGTERLVDVGDVDGAPFVGIASVGLDSDVNRIANDARLIPGAGVYVYATLRALAGWSDARFQVEVDDRRHEVTGYSVAVANSGVYGGGMRLVPHARLDDGVLDVLTIASTPKLRLARTLPKVYTAGHLRDPAVTLWSGERVEIAADRPFVVYADGDPIGALPVTVGVARRSLRVVAPPPNGEGAA